jgi:hypothetical protein
VALTYITTFTVGGGTRFPLDMLRYDACYPYSGEDAAYMDRALDRDIPRAERTAHPIKLAHVHIGAKWRPTSERWSSFLWGVDPQSISTRQL